jgi:hypothetical protein
MDNMTPAEGKALKESKVEVNPNPKVTTQKKDIG